MSRSLEARIEKLEAERGTGKVLTVTLRSFNDGELTGLQDVRGGSRIERQSGEAEETFRQRAESLAHAFPADGCSMCVMREMRA